MHDETLASQCHFPLEHRFYSKVATRYVYVCVGGDPKGDKKKKNLLLAPGRPLLSF